MSSQAGPSLRVLCAPVGSGITTALLDYARSNAGVAYLAPPAGSGRFKMEALLHESGDAREFVIDGADRLAADGMDAVLAFAAAVPRRPILLAGNARSALRVHTLIAHGQAELMDPSLLAFDADEIARLAMACGVDARPDDVLRVFRNTDGWAIAVSWLVRDASRERGSLSGAFEAWLDASGHILREYLHSAITERRVADAFDLVAAAETYTDLQAELRRFSGLGYPIVRTDLGLRPNPILRRLARGLSSFDSVPEDDRCLNITLFGRFRCRAGDDDVVFVRRRDRNVLIFLALAPDGRLTRSELAAAFWPNLPASVASQGIRTTLSRLRRSLGAAAGGDPDLYLRSGNVVALNLEKVVVDARRFTEHTDHAERAIAVKDWERACRHLLFAEALQSGGLLRSEAIEPVQEPLVAHYVELARAVTARLLTMRHMECPPAERRLSPRPAAQLSSASAM